MSEEYKFKVAVLQLAMLVVAMLSITVLAAIHAVPSSATVTLLGVIFTHAGITAYNGATKGGGRAPRRSTDIGEDSE